MSRSVPPLLFSLVFGEADSRDWEDITGLFATPAGELTDDEIQRLVVLRKMVAERAETLGHALRSVRDSLHRLLSFVEEITEQTIEGDESETTRRLLRLLGDERHRAHNMSPPELEFLRGLAQTPLEHSESRQETEVEEELSPQMKLITPSAAVTSTPDEDDMLYPRQQPEALDETAETAPGDGEVLYPPVESERVDSNDGITPSGLASSILRQYPPQRSGSDDASTDVEIPAPAAAPSDTHAAGSADDGERGDVASDGAPMDVETPVPTAAPPVAPAVVRGDYTELSDVAVWQAISSGAARIPSDLQRLRREKEGPVSPGEPASPKR